MAEIGTSEKLIKFVKDRPGHDNVTQLMLKINKNLDGIHVTFEEGLEITVDWYLNNRQWLENIISGDYMEYYNNQYNK